MTAGSPPELLAKLWGDRLGYIFLPVKRGAYWYEAPGQFWYGEGQLPSLEPASVVDLYFCPLVFSEPHRRKALALPTNLLWADLDAADPRKMRLKPSVAWETSGGRFQGLWLLDHDIPANTAASLSRAIAYAEPGADRGGWDVTQVLRIPGSLNHKREEPEKVRLLWAKRLYRTVEEVTAAYPPPAAVTPSTSLAVTAWPDVSTAEIDRVRAALPIGIRRLLTASTAGADRSFQIQLLARHLLRWGVPPAIAVHLLQCSTWNKYAGRDDEHARLLDHVARAGVYSAAN